MAALRRSAAPTGRTGGRRSDTYPRIVPARRAGWGEPGALVLGERQNERESRASGDIQSRYSRSYGTPDRSSNAMSSCS